LENPEEFLPDGVPSLSDELAKTDGVLKPSEDGRLIIIEPPDTGPKQDADDAGH
jgi:hypothetical protein